MLWKVSWGNAEAELGTYTAKCDHSTEQAANSPIRCWQTGPNVVEGETLSVNDPQHMYYPRVLSNHGKAMSIIWYLNAKRRQVLDRFVYTKQ